MSIKCNPKKYESTDHCEKYKCIKNRDEMVDMKAILMSYMYIEFDNTVYFLGIMLEKRFFEYKDIGGNRSERYVLQEIHCNSNSAYTIL